MTRFRPVFNGEETAETEWLLRENGALASEDVSHSGDNHQVSGRYGAHLSHWEGSSKEVRYSEGLNTSNNGRKTSSSCAH